MLPRTFGAMNRSYELNQSIHQSIKSHLHCGKRLYILCGGTALVLSATERSATDCIRAHRANVQMQLHAYVVIAKRFSSWLKSRRRLKLSRCNCCGMMKGRRSGGLDVNRLLTAGDGMRLGGD